MPGKCKILLVLAVFLAAFTAIPPGAFAQAADDCDCGGPNGSCAPGSTGVAGAFQQGIQKALALAGQDSANAYNYGSNQVIRIDVGNNYGLNNIKGIFQFAIQEYQTVMDDVASGTPNTWIVDDVVDLLITRILTQVFSTYLTPALTTLFAEEQNMLCRPMPSNNPNQLSTKYKTLMLNPNCNAIGAAAMALGVSVVSQPRTIYQLYWGQ
jgi:hypothetical protein